MFATIQSCLDTPPLVVKWLGTLFDKLIAHDWFSEAAQCKAHIAFILFYRQPCSIPIEMLSPNLGKAICPKSGQESFNPFDLAPVLESLTFAIDAWNKVRLLFLLFTLLFLVRLAIMSFRLKRRIC
jgi:hypothetical protein